MGIVKLKPHQFYATTCYAFIYHWCHLKRFHESLIHKLEIFSGPNDSLCGQQHYLKGFEINEIYVTALYHRDVKWASWHLKSPDNRLFVQQIVQANTKAPHHWYSLRGLHIRKADSYKRDSNVKNVSISCHSLRGILESKRQKSCYSEVTNTNGLRAPLAVDFDKFRIFIHCISYCDCNNETTICFKNLWICLYSVCRPQSRRRTGMTPIARLSYGIWSIGQRQVPGTYNLH